MVLKAIINNISTAIVVSFFALLVGFLLWVLIARIRASRSAFIRTEELFDKEYMKKRTEHSFKMFGVFYPFEKVEKVEFGDLGFVKNANVTFQWYDKVRNMEVSYLPTLGMGLYTSFVYDIFYDLKDFDSPLSKKFLEERPKKIRYWDDMILHDLRTKVKNILTIIPSLEVISSGEFLMLVLLANEIAVNGLFKDEKRLSQVMGLITVDHKIEDVGKTLNQRAIIPLSFDHMRIMYEVLASEMNVRINIYDIRFNVDIRKLCNFTADSQNPLREFSYLISDNFNNPMNNRSQ